MEGIISIYIYMSFSKWYHSVSKRRLVLKEEVSKLLFL